jgi:hypothetical protein
MVSMSENQMSAPIAQITKKGIEYIDDKGLAITDDGYEVGLRLALYDESEYEEMYNEMVEEELRERAAVSEKLGKQGGFLVIEM